MKAITALLAIALLAGCGEDDVNLKPDESDWRFACHGTTGIYITQDDVESSPAIAVLGDHPKCTN